VFFPVEQIMGDALDALEADRPLVIPGLPMKISVFLVRITPCRSCAGRRGFTSKHA
jgi:hypothetical protein